MRVYYCVLFIGLASCYRTPLERLERAVDAKTDAAFERFPDLASADRPNPKSDRPLDLRSDLPIDTRLDRLPDLRLDTIPDLAPDLVEVLPYKDDCTDSSVKFIYIVTLDFELYAFRPQSLTWEYRGTLNCPSESTPFSMAVDRAGVAYVHYRDGDLFKVSTVNARCESTLFSSAYGPHGMGFATDSVGPEERLYLASTFYTPPELRVLDLTDFLPKFIGASPTSGMELTGTGDGRLYAFYDDGVAHLVELDKASAISISDITLPTIRAGRGFALSFWGGDFYFFTAPLSESIVSRYSPRTGAVEVVSSLPGKLVVGAGASTCAPER
jgi:hypothetical protein